jgi:hypothetical protein
VVLWQKHLENAQFDKINCNINHKARRREEILPPVNVHMQRDFLYMAY